MSEPARNKPGQKAAGAAKNKAVPARPGDALRRSAKNDDSAAAPESPETAPKAQGEPDPASTATFRGYVDGLNQDWRIVGWVRSLVSDEDHLGVQLLEGEVVLDSVVADFFRGDLVDAKLGTGHSGFLLKIPEALFDGLRHSLSVCVAGVPAPNLLGSLVVALPNRGRAKSRAGQSKSAMELVRDVLAHRPAARDYDPHLEAKALTRVLEAIAATYDTATALGLLYIHVLRRRIDADGLQTRLTRLSMSETDMARVVSEVLESEEAQALYKAGAEARFPDIAALEISTQLRLAG